MAPEALQGSRQPRRLITCAELSTFLHTDKYECVLKANGNLEKQLLSLEMLLFSVNFFRKGPWSPEEDQRLRDYNLKHGLGCWPCKGRLWLEY
ncbi:hypothetical protein TRIUR3_33411 [Triticum urartu]|uniref:Myb-like domain-containing protein n=1 Tax=Triticum urartu TaxID=4572 RepID=M7YN20_TRIUA|nr:hypothetical protein TRIUR3_33411 [Triticum urartu]